MASDRGGNGLKSALAAVFAIGGLALAVWMWQSSGRPTPAEARAARGEGRAGQAPRAMADASGAAPADSAAGGAREVETSGPSGPAGEGAVTAGPGRGGGGPSGGGEVRVGNLAEAAKAMGITEDQMRASLEWMKTDADAMPGATFDHLATKADADAAHVRQLLEKNIEKEAAGLLSWSPAPTKTASDLAAASAEALLGRVRGGDAFSAMVTKLGGDVGAIPPATARGAAAMTAALDGAQIDPTKVRVRSGGGGGPMERGRGGPLGTMMVMKNQMGDGPEITQVGMPTGAMFPAADAGNKSQHAVDVRVPLKPAGVSAKPGTLSLAVTMVMVKDGQWQPAQFSLFIADEAAEKALLPPRRRN